MKETRAAESLNEYGPICENWDGVPTGIRTRVSALKGRIPIAKRPLVSASNPRPGRTTSAPRKPNQPFRLHSFSGSYRVRSSRPIRYSPTVQVPFVGVPRSVPPTRSGGVSCSVLALFDPMVGVDPMFNWVAGWLMVILVIGIGAVVLMPALGSDRKPDVPLVDQPPTSTRRHLLFLISAIAVVSLLGWMFSGRPPDCPIWSALC